MVTQRNLACMQQSNERTRGESHRWLKSTPGLVDYSLASLALLSIPPTLSAGELRCQKWWSNAFTCVTPSHNSFISPPPLNMTKGQDETPQHPKYSGASEKSVIDRMLGTLHTIQLVEPVTRNAKMTHSP